jgi:BASS family bile acid:Na+ symporter
MPPDFIKTVMLPVALIIIMFGMGMTLRRVDFQRVLLSPKSVLIGLACQLLGLPVIAFYIASFFKLPGELATGLVLVALCSGGATSNIISHLAKGDTALSVTLTAASTLITVFTLPLLLPLAMVHFLAESQIVSLPFTSTFLQLVIVTLLPLSLGMWLHAARPAFSRRMAGTFNGISIVFVGSVVIVAVINEKNLGAQILQAGPAAVTLNLCGMALGYAAAKACRLPPKQVITIAIEVGIQNAAVSLTIALGMLQNSSIAMPAVVYSLFMLVSGSLVILWHGRASHAVR